MELIATPLGGVYIVQVNKIEDTRGLFARTYCKKEFSAIGFTKEFVQFNHSFNKEKGTVRGMHFQRHPFTETKLIRCIQGSVWDVAIDLRKGSSTYLQHFAIELSKENMKSILIPDGFAHGFQSLEDNTTLIYHHTNYYTSSADSGIRFDDPALNIQWPLPAINVSEKDQNYHLITSTFESI